jgi:hypothetical protein
MHFGIDKDTRKSILLVLLLNSKFASQVAVNVCELRVRGTSDIDNWLDRFAFQGAFRRPRFIGRESRIVPIERRTVRTNVFVVVAHIAEHVWMIERRQGADTHELFGADLDLGYADIVVEMRNDMLGHVFLIGSAEDRHNIR